jgi:hypothetical protein
VGQLCKGDGTGFPEKTKKAPNRGLFCETLDLKQLLGNVAIVALGGAAFFGVTVFADVLVSGVFGHFDFGRLALMASFAAQFFAMAFVVKGHDPFAFVGVNVGGESGGGGKGGEHGNNQQFFHGGKTSSKGN